ncbi:MAG: synthase subunit alpha, partial [Acidobacteria bacterium]|nr:synthase subunit alpha [Acidobacteriota bacterium]
LARHFREHPPEGFEALVVDGVPAFATTFDLFTTAPAAVQRRVQGLSRLRWLQRYLRPVALFVGTTVTEYALFPRDRTAEDVIRELVAVCGPRYPFVIVKDLPTDAALVSAQDLAYSRGVTEACVKNGFVLVEGQALAHVPIDFASVDEYLARLSHARRKNIRRKLRSRSALNIEAIGTGDARFGDVAFLATLYRLYRNVYAQSEIHFDLLTPEFFRAVLQDGDAGGVVFTYRAGGKLVGHNLCFREQGILIDKFVGFEYPDAQEHDLYTVSWFHNLQYALEHGLHHYVAGWTDPEVKRQLGAQFTFTQHAVFVRNAFVRALLQSFRSLFEADRNWELGHAVRADP